MDDKFYYKYSAPTQDERREIESIKREYTPRTITDMDKLRALHARVTRPAFIVSLTMGIVGVLVFGLGLTLILEWAKTIAGVIVSAIGALIMIPAYFVNGYILRRQKKKYGDEIIALSDALLGKENIE